MKAEVTILSTLPRAPTVASDNGGSTPPRSEPAIDITWARICGVMDETSGSAASNELAIRSRACGLIAPAVPDAVLVLEAAETLSKTS